MGTDQSLHREAIKNSVVERRSETDPIVIEFPTHSSDGLNLYEKITAEDLRGPHDPIWNWFELWVDYFSEDEGDASWKLTFGEPVSRLNLARRIQTEYLETYKEGRGTPYLRRLVQSKSDPTAFDAEIVRI